MTRQIMIARAHGNLMLEEGDDLLRWAGPNEEYDLDEAADDTSRATYCYTADQIMDLVANQAVYCFPKIFKPKGFYTIDANGNRIPLTPTTSAQLDRYNLHYGCIGTYTGTGASDWRKWNASDGPHYRVMSGINEFEIAPVAKTTVTGGVIVSGFALSTLPGAGRTRHQWDLPNDPCPLPEQAHDAVVLRFTALLCARMSAKADRFFTLEDRYTKRWQLACGEIAASAAKNYRGGR